MPPGYPGKRGVPTIIVAAMLRARLLVPVLAAIIVAAGAGCGKAVSKGDYEQAVAPLLGQIDSALRLVESATPDDIAAAAEEARPLLLSAADGLDEVGAPKGLSEAHNLLVDGIRELADDVVEVAGASSAQDIPEVLDAIATMPSLEKLQRAQELFAREEVTLEIGTTLVGETGAVETGTS
jgi:hypothetical protein